MDVDKRADPYRVKKTQQRVMPYIAKIKDINAKLEDIHRQNILLSAQRAEMFRQMVLDSGDCLNTSEVARLTGMQQTTVCKYMRTRP